MDVRELSVCDGVEVDVISVDHELESYWTSNDGVTTVHCRSGTICVDVSGNGSVIDVRAGHSYALPPSTRLRIINGSPPGTLAEYLLITVTNVALEPGR